MNEHVRTRDIGGSIRTVEELARRRWTTAELLALTEAGQLDPDLEFELIRGKIIAMNPAGRFHEVLRTDLTDFLIRRRPHDIRVDPEPQFNLTEETYRKPDILVRPASIQVPDVRGPDALLVIEIADSSFDFDLSTKAPFYAAFGVREYWVIAARSLLTRVHRGPSATGYAAMTDMAGDRTLMPFLAPALAVRLDGLTTEPG
jgi:Uma2 family endonuclease